MKFDPCKCPECGEIAIGTVDLIPGIALLDFDDDGEADYVGETKVCWDGQFSETDAEDRTLLSCGEHEWYATCEE
jgi:hypothetical protein